MHIGVIRYFAMCFTDLERLQSRLPPIGSYLWMEINLYGGHGFGAALHVNVQSGHSVLMYFRCAFRCIWCGRVRRVSIVIGESACRAQFQLGVPDGSHETETQAGEFQDNSRVSVGIRRIRSGFHDFPSEDFL